MARFIGNHALPLGAQVISMRRKWPQFIAQWNHSGVTWIGTLQPGACNREYTIAIDYKLGERPDVTVLSPVLRDRSDQNIPHVYPGKHPCLHLPSEWAPTMHIADTIVPWASDWLFFYEVWHATGEWLADGEHPDKKPSDLRRLGRERQRPAQEEAHT